MKKIIYKRIAVVSFIILVAIFTYSFRKTISKQLYAWELFPQSETFTELYFNNYMTLPPYVWPNQQVTFSFTIHNLEEKQMTYQYEVYITSDTARTTLDQKSITLTNNQSKTVTENYTYPNQTPPTHQTYVVNLKNINQAINFFVTGVNVAPKVTPPIPTPTPIQYKWGAWYWQPDLGRAQQYYGTNSAGVRVFVDAIPTPTHKKKK